MRLLALCAWLAVPTASDPGSLVIHTPSKHPGGVPEAHAEWIRDVIVPQLELRATVTYRDCGTANAYYRASDRTITICHELWNRRRALYVEMGLGEDELEHVLAYAMAFTVFHEAGHAMHSELDLPLVGSIEDAVDEIATMWLVHLGGDALEIAKQAAYGHYLETKSGRDHDFWDEHGSGAQRGFAIACMLYGADRTRVTELVDGMHVPAKRLAKCAGDHARRVATWKKLFAK